MKTSPTLAAARAAVRRVYGAKATLDVSPALQGGHAACVFVPTSFDPVVEVFAANREAAHEALVARLANA